MALNIGCLGTTRKNAAGIPQPLLDAKDVKQGLVWNSIIAMQAGWTLSFIWQDNNAVLGIITAFSVYKEKDSVERLRKRPKFTSINARIVRPVFGNKFTKRLRIPNIIDVYNYGINRIDTANQLRTAFTYYRPRNRK